MNPPSAASPLPAGLSVERSGSGTVFSLRWRNMASWALLPLGVVAAGIPVGLFLKLREIPYNHPMQLLVVVFGVVGLIFTYIVVQRLVNVTRLEVTPERLRVSHGPVPWRRPIEIATATIRQVEVRPFQWRYDGSVVTHYHLWSVEEAGRETCLLERDTTEEQARYVGAALQQVLPGKGAGNPAPPTGD